MRLKPRANGDLTMSSSVFERLLVLYAKHFPIRRGKLTVIDSYWRVANHSQHTRRVAVLKHGGFTMSCDLAEMLQRQSYFLAPTWSKRMFLIAGHTRREKQRLF